MNANDLQELIETIEETEKIECYKPIYFGEDDTYTKILAALKQNIEFQNQLEELGTTKEKLYNQNLELVKRDEEKKNSHFKFMNELCKFLSRVANKEPQQRIGDYIFEHYAKGVRYKFEPIEEPEPIKLEITVVESNSDKELCPICKNELGKYPAISRKDNTTEICSNCGTLEALEMYIDNKNNLEDKE